MLLDLKQNTPEWDQLRKTSIGASDIPIILGLSPYKTPWMLYGEKLGIRTSPKLAHMQMGHDAEEIARPLACEKFGMNFTDQVHRHPELDWAIASLDGYDPDTQIVLEIKYTNQNRFDQIKSGYFPEDWQAQMQWQMFVSGSEKAILMAACKEKDVFYPEDEPQFSVFYLDLSFDRDFIMKNLSRIAIFHDSLFGGEPPEMSDKDVIFIDSDDFQVAEKDYVEAKREYDYAKAKMEGAKQKLIDLSDDGNCEGALVKLTRSTRIGAVDWKKLTKDQSISDAVIERYRKPEIGIYTVTVKKESESNEQ